MKKYVLKIIIANLILLIPLASLAYQFPPNTYYDVCFTPGGACTSKIVNLINNAKKEILVQAYSFTSAPIAKSLVGANRRGVNVKVILDKSQFKHNKYSASRFLLNNNISVWIDYKPAIAHNKVIIVDNNIVETGSFNYTKSAQYRNAENVLIIKNYKLAQIYKDNWFRRKHLSKKVANTN